MPLRTARTVGSSLVVGTLAGLLRWLASSIIIAGALAAIVLFLVKLIWPSAGLPAALVVFFAFPVVMLPWIWSNAVRCGVTAALRDSGLSRTIADCLLSAAARAMPGAGGSAAQLAGVDERIRTVVFESMPIRPHWLRRALTGLLASRISRQVPGRLGDLAAASGSEPEVLRDRVAASIETLTGDWAARRRAA